MDDPIVSSGSTPGEMTFDQALGQVIREEREHRGYSLEELGGGIISGERISAIENGFPVDPAEALFLAARLYTDVNNLIRLVEHLRRPKPIFLPVARRKPQQLRSVDESERKTYPEPNPDSVSRKHLVILELLARGWTYDEIAGHFGYKRGSGPVQVMVYTLKDRLNIRHPRTLEEFVREHKEQRSLLGLRLLEVAEELGDLAKPVSDTPQREELGQRIRNVRLARGLSGMDVVGNRHNVGWLSFLELYGVGRVTEEDLDHIAKVLDVPVEELKNGGPSVDPLIAGWKSRVEENRQRSEAEAKRRKADVALRYYERSVNACHNWQGQTLRRLRLALGDLRWYQYDLGSDWPEKGRLESRLDRVELGHAYLTPELADKVAQVLKVPAQELLKGGSKVDWIITTYERDLAKPAGREPNLKLHNRPEISVQKAETSSVGEVPKESVPEIRAHVVDQEIARRIRRLRELRGLPQRAIAEANLHSPPWASNLEAIIHTRQARYYNYDEIEKIAALLEISLSDLLDEEGSAFYSLLEGLEAEHRLRAESWRRKREEPATESERQEQSAAGLPKTVLPPVPRRSSSKDLVEAVDDLRRTALSFPKPHYAVPNWPVWQTRYIDIRKMAIELASDIALRESDDSIGREIITLARLIVATPPGNADSSVRETWMSVYDRCWRNLNGQLSRALSLTKKGVGKE